MQVCQEVEAELRELSQECRKKYPIIKEYTDRAILKIRHHREDASRNGHGSGSGLGTSDFPLDEVLRAILMACETFHNKIVMISLSCLQRLIHREALKEETVAIVVNLMKEQAANGDETVQLKVLQTIMATPSHIKLLNETVVEQLMQLLYSLHNSSNASVHHTACAGLRQLAEHLADQAAQAATQMELPTAGEFQNIRSVMRRAPVGKLPNVAPNQAPDGLRGPLRMYYIFVQDLCVMADYDVSSMSTRYSMDPSERMRTGNREGYWLADVKFPRPLCLELLGACISSHPSIFKAVPACFALLRHNVCAALLKNLRGCFDFAILIRSVQLLQQIFHPALAADMLPELQVFLHLMLDLTNAERSLWQRATSLEFLRSVCEDPMTIAVLYSSEHASQAASSPSNAGAGASELEQPKLFLELVNALSKLMHQVCFSSGGMDSSAAPTAGASSTASPVLRNAGHEGRGSLQNANLLDRSSDGSAGSAGRATPRVKLLLLMNETEPPPIQPAFLVSLVVECVFAVVSSIYRLLLETEEDVVEEAAGETPVEQRMVRATSTPDGPFPGGRLSPLRELSQDQERCKGMLADTWASILSALALLLHGTQDSLAVQQALRCLQTLLYCCSRLSLDQARDACLLQFSRYAWPSHAREGDAELAISAASSGSNPAGTPTAKNLLCFKALVHYCYRFGSLLGEPGWTIALRAFHCLERTFQKAAPVPGSDLSSLRQALDSVFETTSLLPDAALADVVGALGRNLRTADTEEGTLILHRMVDLCNFNLARLFLVWDSILSTITEVCTAEEKTELRGQAATTLCLILGQALRKGALALADHPEEAQDKLLRHLEVLLRSPHDDARARICEGLLSILQTSGQELHKTAWGTMIHLVSTAASVELERVGASFDLAKDGLRSGEVGQKGGSGTEARDAASAGLPTVFALLELLVHDFMESVPQASIPRLTTSIGALARFQGLGVNSSLTAVGFLWNVADALARYHCAEGSASFEELWVQIFMQLRALASDSRPEVRNCAVKSLSTALLSHGRKVGTECYSRCLSDILMKVLAEIQDAAREARQRGTSRTDNQLIVHHSRDTPEKQWDETVSLAFEGVRRVLNHFSEEAGPEAFAPLAYGMLLHIQETMRALTPETTASAVRALVDLMRIPASCQTFQVTAALRDSRGPTLTGETTTSVWALSWKVLWGMVSFCLSREVPELVVEAFTSSLSALRFSHGQMFTTAQHLILLQLSCVLVTAPSFYLLSTPWEVEAEDTGANGSQEQSSQKWLSELLCEVPLGMGESDREVFEFVEASSSALWARDRQQGGKPAHTEVVAPLTDVIAPNASAADIWSTEELLQSLSDSNSSEEVLQTFLGPSRTPTHRTMLHTCSARLQHVQGTAFSLLEEIPSFEDGYLEALFLCQMCVVFLDLRHICVDSNRLALAVRSLCVLIVFCRRTLLHQLLKLSGEKEISLQASRHLEHFLGAIVPRLLEVLTDLACGKGRKAVRRFGLWKLALEALFYLVEDSLAGVARCELEPDAAKRYWDALITCFSKVLGEALPARPEGNAGALLSQVLGNLLMQRILPCSKTPASVAEDAVHLLQVLVSQQGMGSSSLRHFFALCGVQSEVPETERPNVDGEEMRLSVIAATARGAPTLSVKGIPCRSALLGIAVPALVAHVRSLFALYLQDEEARQRGAPVADAAAQKAVEVRQALTLLQKLQVDEAAVAAATSGISPKASSACSLAGSRGLVMALLPQLASLASVGAPDVRRAVREVLEALATELEL